MPALSLMLSMIVHDWLAPIEISACKLREDLCVGSRLGIECDMLNEGSLSIYAIRFRVSVSASKMGTTDWLQSYTTKVYEEVNPPLPPKAIARQVFTFEGTGMESDLETLIIEMTQISPLDYFRERIEN